MSRRRLSDEGNGDFAGVIQASVLPEYFEGFYEKLAREPGEYTSIAREDGTLLARYPSLGRDAKLAEKGPLYQSMLANPAAGKVTLISAIDGAGRTVSYRKLPDFRSSFLRDWRHRQSAISGFRRCGASSSSAYPRRPR